MRNKIIKKLIEWIDIIDPYWTKQNFKNILIIISLFIVLHTAIHYLF